MADRPKRDGDRPKRPGGSGFNRGGPGGSRGGPGGSGRPPGPGGFRGPAPDRGHRDGPGFDPSGASERRGFGFSRGPDRGPDRPPERGPERGHETPFRPRQDGPPGRSFDRGRPERGGGRGYEPDRPLFRDGPSRDERPNTGDSRGRPWDRPAPPWADRDRGSAGPGGPGGPGGRRSGGFRPDGPRPGARPGGFGGGRPAPFDRPRDDRARDDRPRDHDHDHRRPDRDEAFEDRQDPRPAPPQRGDHAERGPAPFRPNRGFGGRPGGPGRDRPAFDRPWRDPSQRPVDAYRPGVAPSDLLGDNEELVAGRRPVEEAFVAKRPARRLLVVPQRRQALERLVLHATSLRIPVVEVEGGSLTAVAGFDGHQGIALVVEPRVFAGLDDVLARAVERGEPPFILVLDSLEDPQNVGTLLRSAEAAGVHGVLFPTHRQAPLSPAAIKASAGAVEHLLLCPVDDLAGALSDLRIRGLRVAAAEADAPLTTAQADLRGPLAIVVGSEGQGLSPLIRRRADVAVRIPMRGAIGSLNAAVAGSILLFSAVAQRDLAGEGSEARPRPATFDEIVDAAAAPGPDAASSIETPIPVAVKPGRKPRKGLSTEPVADGAIDGLATLDPAEPAAEAVSDEPATATPGATLTARTSKPAKAAMATKPVKASKPEKPTKPLKATKATKPAATAPTTKATRSTKASKPTTAGSGPVEIEASSSAVKPRRKAAVMAAIPVAERAVVAAKAPKRRAKATASAAGGLAADLADGGTDEDLLPGGPSTD